MTEHLRRRAFRGAVAAAVALSVGLLAWLGLAGGTPTAARVAVGVWIVTAAAIAVAGVQAARVHSGRERVAWALIAAAGFAWAAGDVAWFVKGFVLESVSFPSVVDVMWIPAPVLALAGVLAFPSSRSGSGGRVRAVLDGLLVATGFLLVSWPVLLDHIVHRSGGSAIRVVVSVWSPVCYVVVLSVLAVSLTQGVLNARPILVLAGGVTVFAVASMLWGYQMADGTYAPGALADALNGVAQTFVALAAFDAFLHPRRTHEHEGRRSLATDLVLYVLLIMVALSIATLGHTFQRELHYHPALVWLGLSLLVLVALRQTQVVFENRRLRSALERDVEARTTEAAGLQRLRDLILDAAADGILGLDRDGRVSFANPVALDMLGTNDAQGRTFHDVAGHRLASGVLCTEDDCKIAAAVAGLPIRSDPGEIFEGLSGAGRPVEYTATPITREGRPVGAVVVFRDVTERAQIDRMKDDVLSVVSHELRTPLTSIRGSLRLLASGRLGEFEGQARELVDIASSSSERLARLVDDILDLAHLESGMMEFNLEACDTVQLVAEAARAMWSQASERRIELVATGEPIILPAADFDRIQQVLTNLIGNAVKFSEPGGEVRVSVAAEGSEAVFHVTDHGVGIPPQHLDAVFDRFHQVDGTTLRSTGGAGLGLTICRDIVDLHGGRIWAESAPGKGSTFSFALPLSRRPRASGARPPRSEAPGVPEAATAVSAGSGGTEESP